MGLDARVYCNCWVQGLTTPPPVPRQYIAFNSEGWLSFDPPDKTDIESYIAFDRWEETCCIHPGMAYARLHVSNWWGYRVFQDALKRAGWEHFPTLHAELPAGNEGSLSVTSALKALKELDYFKHNAELGTNFFLIDTETGKWIHEYNEASGGIVVWSDPSQVDIGFNRMGLFIVTRGKDALLAAMDAAHGRVQSEETSLKTVLFRAMRLEQRLLEPEKTESFGRGKVQFIDRDSDARFVCTSAIPGRIIPWPDGRMQDDKGRVRTQYPRYLHVEERPVSSGHFSYILDSLSEIFRASIEMGNSVLWS